MSVQITLTDRQFLLMRDAVNREGNGKPEYEGMLRSIDSQAQAQEVIGAAINSAHVSMKGQRL